MANTNKNQNSSKAGWGAGVAAAVAAAAIGAYLLYGKDGAKNRKKVKGWMLKAKGEILERMEQLENVSEDNYRGIVEAVAARYKGLKGVDPADLRALVLDAKKHWAAMKRTVAGRRSSSAKRSGARKSSRKAPARKKAS